MNPSQPHFPLLLAYTAQGKQLEDTHDGLQFEHLDIHSLYWFAIYRPVLFDLEWGSHSEAINTFCTEERQNSIPLQTLSSICNRCENLEDWLLLHKSLKIWVKESKQLMVLLKDSIYVQWMKPALRRKRHNHWEVQNGSVNSTGGRKWLLLDCKLHPEI